MSQIFPLLLFIFSFDGLALEKCTPPNLATFSDPRMIVGTRTKWELDYASTDTRKSIQPDLHDMFPSDWLKNIEDAGINIIEVNMDPSRLLKPEDSPRLTFVEFKEKLKQSKSLPDYSVITEKVLSDNQWDRYIQVLFKPNFARTEWEKSFLNMVSSHFIPNYIYTPKQRNLVLLTFLKSLEEARRSCKVKATARFIIHQRLWFGGEVGESNVYTNFATGYEDRISDFTKDFSDFINLLKTNRLDDWIAGVRLGEHASENMDVLLPTLVKLATELNKDINTNNWLQNKIFLSNAGGWGLKFNGIRGASKDHRFFENISNQVGGFAFGYKWMTFHNQGFIRQQMIQTMTQKICGYNLAIKDIKRDSSLCKLDEVPRYWRDSCDTKKCDILKSEKAWRHFYLVKQGLSEYLARIRYLQSTRKNLSHVANLVFVGDSSDSVNLMTDSGPDGEGFVKAASLRALEGILRESKNSIENNALDGKLFMNAYHPHIANSAYPKTLDTGLGLMNVKFCGKGGRCFYSLEECSQNANQCQKSPLVEKLPLSFDLWSNWLKTVQ